MSIIRVEDISHVRFAAPDLAAMRSFLEDFGLECFEEAGLLYARGRDESPFAHVTELGAAAFRALGLRAAGGKPALQELARQTGSRVEPFDAPGGGYLVRLRDPDGNLIEVVSEQTPAVASSDLACAPVNSADVRRRFSSAVRIAKQASRVFRLGHAVLNVRDFARAERWYKEHFGFLTSHQIEAAPGTAIGAFLRCDRGEEPTDHHTLFLMQLPAAGPLNHVAFEVTGLDDLMAGHAHLAARGRKAAWGVGRHKLGSQIFDYWKDPWGNELEHWTDGDLLTVADGSETASLRDLIEVQWGAPFPPLARAHAPSPEILGKIMALALRLKRLAGRDTSGVSS